MRLFNINPYIRFAMQILYNSKQEKVIVPDCRIFYCISGSAVISIGNEKIHLKADSVFYCCAGSSYSIESDSELSLIVFNFDLSTKYCAIENPIPRIYLGKENQHTQINRDSVEDSDILNSFVVIKDGSRFFPVIQRIKDEFSMQQAYHRELCSGLLKSILIELHRNFVEKEAGSNEIINFVLDYLQKNYEKTLNNKGLASLTGYHEYYLNRIFKRRIGIGMHQYILTLRLSEAKRLLLNTDLPLAVIAERVGYNNNTHFSNYFKKSTSMTPKQYRNYFKKEI